MTYGLYLGLAFSTVITILNFRGIIHYPGDMGATINAMILSFGMLYFGKKYATVVNQNNFLYRHALRFLVMLVFFSSLIYAFFSYWYYSVIQPEGISFYIRQMQNTYLQMGTFSEEQINALSELYSKTLTPGVMAFIVFFAQSFFGVLLSLIMAVTIKSKNIIKQP
jgi:hypothetical protein